MTYDPFRVLLGFGIVYSSFLETTTVDCTGEGSESITQPVIGHFRLKGDFYHCKRV